MVLSMLQPTMPHRNQRPPRTIVPLKRKHVAELVAVPANVTSKRETIAQACETCRRLKRKCGGQRPVCQQCINKRQACMYEFGEGVSRHQANSVAKKSRLDSLEKVVRALQTASLEEAQQMLLDIRSAGNTVSRVDVIPKTEDVESTSSMEYFPWPKQEEHHHSKCKPTCHHVEEPAKKGQRRRSLRGCYGPSSPKSLELFPTSDGSGIGLISFVLPDFDTTKRAIEVFYSCAGKLFHVFSREQVAAHNTVLMEAREGAQSQGRIREALCCVMAVAAVGALYVADGSSQPKGHVFYDAARCYLDDLIERRPYDAIKVCTLLAQYNVLNKATVSLSYVELGISLCRMYGLNAAAGWQGKALSAAEWHDCRKAWRTLVFFNCWLESTLGYISSNDTVLHKEQFADLGIGFSTDITETVPTELAKICILKANILRMQLAFRSLTFLSIETIIKDLQSWYDDLPPELQIGYAGRENLPDETRRSILHVHLLYLGAIMLLYRRIASNYAMCYSTRKNDNLHYKPMAKLLHSHGTETVLAAHTSARILKLLLEDHAVFKRCWLVIFQAYTTCIVIMHSVAQKQLHDFDPSEWRDDMVRAADCLCVLEYCASLDPVAARFHAQLRKLVHRLKEQERDILDARLQQRSHTHSRVQSSATHRPARSTDSESELTYLLDIPAHAKSVRVDLSLELLGMLCQPFRGPVKEHDAEKDVNRAWVTDSALYESGHMVARLDWNFGSSEPFHWDFSTASVESAGIAAQTDGAESLVDHGLNCSNASSASS